jgi:multidrug efflux pump subunit AcrA (membrane-fusion protein)
LFRETSQIFQRGWLVNPNVAEYEGKMAFQGRLSRLKQGLKVAQRDFTNGEVRLHVSKCSFIPKKTALEGRLTRYVCNSGVNPALRCEKVKSDQEVGWNRLGFDRRRWETEGMTAQVDFFRLAQRRDDTAGQGVPSRRHLLRRYILPAVLLVGLLGLASWTGVGFLFPSHSVTEVSAHIAQSEVSREGSLLFKAAGWVEPHPAPVRVAALAPGVVDRLLVVEDQPVTAGEAVAELVRHDARHAYERALANLKLREAETEEAQAVLTTATTRLEQPVHLEIPLVETEAALAKIQTQLRNVPFEIRRAESRLDFAKRDYERKSALKGIVAGRAIHEARSALAEATVSLKEHQARRDSLRKEREALIAYRDVLKMQLELKTGEIRAEKEAQTKLKAAKARVRQAEIHLAEAKLRLDRMTVCAPMDGRILDLVVQSGAKLIDGMGHRDMLGDSTVVTMYLPDNLQVGVAVCFEDTPKVSLGQPVRIECPAVPEPLEGRVSFVGSSVDIQRNTLPVKVAFDTPPSAIRPKTLVDVAFLAPSRPSAE